MVTLDTTSLDSQDDDIYSVERGSKVKVFLNGDELRGCVYCNVSKGVAICVKRDLRGLLVVAQDKIVHELIFGDITVEPLAKTTGNLASFEQAVREANNRDKNHKWIKTSSDYER